MESQTKMVIEIPKQLQKEEFRFLLLKKGAKEPIETDWSKSANYKFDEPKLLDHLNNNNNYGIIGGYGNLILVDADSKEINDIAKNKLPETFTIKTGNLDKYKYHYLFICNKKIKPIRLSEKGVGDLGDIRSVGQYVVAANSVHPSGNKYEVIKDLPIMKITEEKVREAFKKFIDKTDSTKFGEFQIITTKRSSPYVSNCLVPDYILNNKLKGDTAKNWKLFRYIVDILHNRGVSDKVYKLIAERQGHSVGAIKGWVEMAREGKLAKSSCRLMRDYLERFHPNLIDDICDKCKYFKGDFEKKNLKPLKRLDYNKLLGLGILCEEKIGKKVVVKISIPKTVDYMRKNFVFKTIFGKSKDDVFVFDNGIYINKGNEIIKKETERLLREYCNNHIVVEVLEKIKRQTAISKDKFDEIPDGIICLKNGILNLKTKELMEYNPKYYFKNMIPLLYDEDADCPNIKRFLEDVLYEEDIKVVEEWFGFNLFRRHFIKKAMIFFGGKNTGKSTLINLLYAFIGKSNICGLSLQKIASGDSFKLGFLKDKYANICDDLSAKDLTESGGFKMATGGSYLNGEYKFGDNFSFLPFSKNLFATNKIPTIKDTDDEAYYSRWIPIPFDNEINIKDQDAFLIDKLTTQKELSGLLNLAVEGLHKLLKNGRFSYDKNIKDIQKTMERHGNSLIAFVQDVLIRKDGNKISKEDMFEIYKKYVDINEFEMLSKEQLGRRLPKYVPYALAKINSGLRFWENIDINKDNKNKLHLLHFKNDHIAMKDKDNNINNYKNIAENESVVSVVEEKVDDNKDNKNKLHLLHFKNDHIAMKDKDNNINNYKNIAENESVVSVVEEKVDDLEEKSSKSSDKINILPSKQQIRQNILKKGEEETDQVEFISSYNDITQPIVEEVLNLMKKEGEIFEPRNGFFKVVL